MYFSCFFIVEIQDSVLLGKKVQDGPSFEPGLLLKRQSVDAKVWRLFFKCFKIFKNNNPRLSRDFSQKIILTEQDLKHNFEGFIFLANHNIRVSLVMYLLKKEKNQEYIQDGLYTSGLN